MCAQLFDAMFSFHVLISNMSAYSTAATTKTHIKKYRGRKENIIPVTRATLKASLPPALYISHLPSEQIEIQKPNLCPIPIQ